MEVDLRPIMNLICILIPLLLSCSQFIKLAVVELNLPPAGPGPSSSSTDDPDPEEKKKLGLKVVITDKGITVASNAAVLGDEAAEDQTAGPTIPTVQPGQQDYRTLMAKLKEITETIKGKNFVDERSVIISAEDGVDYQTILTAMDAITRSAIKELSIEDPATGEKTKVEQPWFSGIALGKIL